MLNVPAGRTLRFAPALAAASVIVAVSCLTRVFLALRPDVAVTWGFADWLGIFGFGLLFDAVAALYLVTPLVLWLALAPDRIARRRLYRASIVLAVFAFAYGALFLAVAEWLFWDEFFSRFNFIAVDYLIYTTEVLGNIRQSYPVGTILLALLLPAAAITAPLARRVWRWSGEPLGWRPALLALLACSGAVAATLAFLSVDVKNFSAEDAANDLAGNGVYEFFAANYRNELSYDRHYATLPLAEAVAKVRAALEEDGGRLLSPGGEGFERKVSSGKPERRLNVVLISVESLGAEFLGAYGDPRGLTPNLDRLSRESLWFAKVFATGNRTVRGMEALALALPPPPGQSIVRRPNNEGLFSLGSVFAGKGYASLFAYGGYGYFDNMNAFFEANGYRAIDRRSIPSDRIEVETIWGVADEHLFDHVLEEIDRERSARPGHPVFAHVMTTSNHRPYVYPSGRIDIPSGTGRDGAVKYSDYAIGRFIEQARARPWFDDTVFVIVADHGVNARSGMQIPVDKYLIPLFVYAPKHVAPRRIDRLMSQIDIAPTLLGLLDFSYTSKFFGRDILHAPPESDRAFVANYQTLGYLKGDRMVVLQPKKKVEVYRMSEDMTHREPAQDPALAREAISFYQTASYAFRSGLYRDVAQAPPERRARTAAAERG
ncbi:MAG: LTA synthase family protein [Betaproteobacteria bacterium]|nr:MAG: LTA synthase family protein [Betaproteobacteria bacterium]